PALPRGTIAWQPQADIYRVRDGWVVKLELARVRPQDVSVSVRGAQLCIAGVRHDWIVKDDWRHYAIEIAYNRFERTIDLPRDLARALDHDIPEALRCSEAAVTQMDSHIQALLDCSRMRPDTPGRL